jgi:hypothetical protein
LVTLTLVMYAFAVSAMPSRSASTLIVGGFSYARAESAVSAAPLTRQMIAPRVARLDRKRI